MSMKPGVFIDQIEREVCVPYPPRRIISLVPSQTELLFDLGLAKELVGITKFCIHPGSVFKSVTKVGGTKSVNLQKIRELKPDLIIGNKEENEQAQVEALIEEFPVWMSDIHILDDALTMISQVGALTNTEQRAQELVFKIREDFRILKSGSRKLTVAYFIWKDPYMIAGKETFIDDVLGRAGFTNISGLSRYPEIRLAELKELRPDLIFLSSEPYPFKDVHVKEVQRHCPDAATMIVDGEMFSWYGSRLLQTPAYIRGLSEKINSIY
jgi:ABC-type Fe3+-hydroxamate transport system substrate-binding protein